MRAPEITLSGAPVFTVELSLLRVSARHPRAFCETELACGFAAASSPWRPCTAATPNMTAYCDHEQSTSGDISPWCFPLEPHPSLIPEPTITMNAQYNVRNYPPPLPQPVYNEF